MWLKWHTSILFHHHLLPPPTLLLITISSQHRQLLIQSNPKIISQDHKINPKHNFTATTAQMKNKNTNLEQEQHKSSQSLSSSTSFFVINRLDQVQQNRVFHNHIATRGHCNRPKSRASTDWSGGSGQEHGVELTLFVSASVGNGDSGSLKVVKGKRKMGKVELGLEVKGEEGHYQLSDLISTIQYLKPTMHPIFFPNGVWCTIVIRCTTELAFNSTILLYRCNLYTQVFGSQISHTNLCI